MGKAIGSAAGCVTVAALACLLLSCAASRTVAPGVSLAEGKADIGLSFCLVPGGEFIMGDEQGGGGDEKPAHRVSVREFYLARHEVTQEQWRRVMGTDPSFFAGCDRCPVENVSWDEVQQFLAKAREMTGLLLRLPTEAEWEYAAGEGDWHLQWAGTDNFQSLGLYAWHHDNSLFRTHPVGLKRPNSFGLHDMTGNVWEWCADWYDKDFYAVSPADDPRGQASGSKKVIRGGSWDFRANYLRVTNRFGVAPGERNQSLGFRPAFDKSLP